jgi:putative ABC transport system permease protein
VIAVANVANLFLARAIGRTGELAVKLALGGGRLRMIAEQAIEGALLSLCGALVALALAVQGTRAVQRVLFPTIDWLDTAISLRDVWLLGGSALAGGALAAGLPAWILTRTRVVDRLKSTGQRVVARRTRAQVSLLVLQAALSVVLLVGAGLFVRSLVALQRLDLGLDTNRLLTVGVAPGETPLRSEFWPMLRERLQRQPDVERTAIAIGTIPFGSSWAVTLNVPGLPERPRVRSGGPYVLAATPDYFETAGTSILEGRRFTDADRQGAPLVAIVNQTLAQLYWPGQSAIGKCLQIGNDSPPCSTIVGVVENTRRWEVIEESNALYYVPLAQAPAAVLRGAQRLIVRAADDRSATLGRLAESIRREALAIDRSVRYVGVQPIGEAIDTQLHAWRLGVTLFAAFGALALLVAGVGLYSVVAFDVEGRRRELGLRAALGARSSTLLRLMLGSTLRIVGAGVLAGIAVAWAAAPFISELLYEVSPHDTVVFAGVASLLLVAAVAATLAPARRATRIDPGEALREN